MSEWISVDYDLPEEENCYLVAWKSDYFNVEFVGICEYTKDNGFIISDMQAYEYYKNANMEVTHWMPLPDAPTV